MSIICKQLYNLRLSRKLENLLEVGSSRELVVYCTCTLKCPSAYSTIQPHFQVFPSLEPRSSTQFFFRSRGKKLKNCVEGLGSRLGLSHTSKCSSLIPRPSLKSCEGRPGYEATSAAALLAWDILRPGDEAICILSPCIGYQVQILVCLVTLSRLYLLISLSAF